MSQWDRWPFVPVSLTDIMDIETLSALLAGCRERLSRPLIVLDYDPVAESFSRRIEPINGKNRFEAFCEFLRDGELVRGGEKLCRRCNIEEAKRSVAVFKNSGNDFRTFPCAMGVLEATHVVSIRGHVVAVFYCGQYMPPEGSGTIREKILQLGKGPDQVADLDEEVGRALAELADQLPPAPDHLHELLEREVRYIKDIAETAYLQQKYLREQKFLDSLRTPAEDTGIIDLETLRELTRSLLEQVRSFCRCDYAVFFGSVQEEETVLPPIAVVGTPQTVAEKPPHFNLRKGGLLGEVARNLRAGILEGKKAIRGDNSSHFAEPGYIVPRTLGNRYRGVLVLGPWQEPVNPTDEHRFLSDIAGVISTAVLTQLEVRNLTLERQRWEKTVKLLTHQLCTALTPANTFVGRAKALVRKMPRDKLMIDTIELLDRAEDSILQLASSAVKTMKGHVLHLEPEDFNLERYPLSVLVSNCVESFVPAAQSNNLQLVLDKTIELLPDAKIDIARLAIAFSNLIENAVKYSFSGTTITVRSSGLSWTPARVLVAEIEVENIGHEIRSDETDCIFEEGRRGLAVVKMRHIHGSGLGLWEARNVVEAHFGTIAVTCDPASVHGLPRTAHRLIFTISIPVLT